MAIGRTVTGGAGGGVGCGMEQSGVFDGWDDGDLREVVCSWKNTVAKNEPNQKAISKARSNLGKIGEK